MNKTLLTDFYQLTMSMGFHKKKMNNDKVVFDLFFRKNPFGGSYTIFAGLEQIINFINDIELNEEDIKYLSNQGFDESWLLYLKDNIKFTGDIYAVPEGSIVFPYEPIIRITAKRDQAQLIETPLLNIINHQTLIATKASRVVNSANGSPVLEFGLRRAQGPDAGIYGARAAVIGGCVATSNVLAGKMFNIPVKGTHAHSWIMSFDSELEAFRAYAKTFPRNCTLLVDTYNTLKSGVPNAIKVFKELKHKYTFENSTTNNFKFGIRLDSGDLAYLSREARKMLDDAGLYEVKIIASSDLDEDIIKSLQHQGAKIDIYGVGTKLITSYNQPALGGVYKLAAEIKDEIIPKIKLSNNPIKITNPGIKKILRVYDKSTGKIKGDLLTLVDENINNEKDLTLYDPEYTWKNITLKANTYELREMLQPIFKNGKCVYKLPSSIKEIQKYCKEELETLWPENKRLINPEPVYVNLSDQLYDLKKEMIYKNKKVN
ncbi:MAG: nicotinate phosphoribosyltransferase [archaeon]